MSYFRPIKRRGRRKTKIQYYYELEDDVIKDTILDIAKKACVSRHYTPTIVADIYKVTHPTKRSPFKTNVGRLIDQLVTEGKLVRKDNRYCIP